MAFEGGPLRWYGQNFEGVAIALSGSGVSEEARLRAAPIGVYEMCVRQQPRYEFGGALLFDRAGSQAGGCEGRRQFEAAEDVDGSERTLSIRSAGDNLPFESLEITPLDWRERPLDFTRLEAGAGQSSIRFEKDAPLELVKIRFSGINVLNVETVAACLWVQGKQLLPDPLTALITRADDVRVDRLGKAAGQARKLEEHLLALFTLIPEIAPGRPCGLECGYEYMLAPGSPSAAVPVLFISHTDFSPDPALAASLAARLSDWYRTAGAAATGAFVFKLTIYRTKSQTPSPAMHLTRLLLPTESIAG